MVRLVKNLRVISADSAAAILDEKFSPRFLVASASVVVDPPYREPSFRLAEPIFKEVDGGFEVIVHEAELCASMLEKMKADVVHLDMSLGGVSVEELSPIELVNLRASKAGRQNILKILPEDQENRGRNKAGLRHRHVGHRQRKRSREDRRVDGWVGSSSVCLQESGG